MSADIVHFQSKLIGEMQRFLEDHVRYAEPWPPIPGVQYFACAVYGEGSRLKAFIVSPDGAKPLPDAVYTNIDEAEAHSIARQYGIDPDGWHYRIDPLETDIYGPTFGKPLAQAFGMLIMWFEEPPPPVPLRERSPRHGLLFDRIVEITEAHAKHWHACWRDGVQVRNVPYNGSRVEALIDTAKECPWIDDLDATERSCELAERAMAVRLPARSQDCA